MANAIKQPADGLALQITRPARQARLVKEDSEGTATYRATVRIHAVDGLLIAVDVDEISDEEEAEIVAAAIEDTGSVYTSIEVSVGISGNGYQVQVSNAPDAGLHQGDTPTVTTAPGLLLLGNPRLEGGGSSERLAADLVTIRRSQLES
jgi:hypothetical protein